MSVSQQKELVGQITIIPVINNVKNNILNLNEEKLFYYHEEHPFPSTRFQGSKNKIVDWIWESIKDIKFKTALDAFGGTGSVAHILKNKGKQVTYNDILKFNYTIGKAIIENTNIKLNNEDINFILTRHNNINYGTFIQENFKDIFYLEEENIWLDMVVANINSINNDYKKSIAWFALFQACIIKRPYNLFHRANLYVRTSEVKRNFGNKTTWDTPFKEHFTKFVEEANNSIFYNEYQCFSTNFDAMEYPNPEFDLVYIDTPYISGKGVGTDYIDFYHFLEGIIDYDNWNEKILRDYKHLPIEGKGKNVWTKKKEIYNAFDRLFNRFQNSKLVISYRSDGIPSEEEMLDLLRKYKSNVVEVRSKEYQYALSKSKSAEVLFIAE